MQEKSQFNRVKVLRIRLLMMMVTKISFKQVWLVNNKGIKKIIGKYNKLYHKLQPIKNPAM